MAVLLNGGVALSGGVREGDAGDGCCCTGVYCQAFDCCTMEALDIWVLQSELQSHAWGQVFHRASPSAYFVFNDARGVPWNVASPGATYALSSFTTVESCPTIGDCCDQSCEDEGECIEGQVCLIPAGPGVVNRYAGPCISPGAKVYIQRPAASFVRSQYMDQPGATEENADAIQAYVDAWNNDTGYWAGTIVADGDGNVQFVTDGPTLFAKVNKCDGTEGYIYNISHFSFELPFDVSAYAPIGYPIHYFEGSGPTTSGCPGTWFLYYHSAQQDTMTQWGIFTDNIYFAIADNYCYQKSCGTSFGFFTWCCHCHNTTEFTPPDTSGMTRELAWNTLCAAVNTYVDANPCVTDGDFP